MHIADILIVYFAYGVPFAVYRMTRIGRSLTLSDSLRFIFWPFVLAAWVRSCAVGNAILARSDIEAGLWEIRTSLEAMVLKDRPANEVLEFREIYQRYAALSATSGSTTTAKNMAGPFGAARSTTAAVCVSRRNRLRREFHRDRAGNELKTWLDGVLTTNPKYGAIVARCVKLALLVNDPELALEFSNMQSARNVRHDFEPVSIPKAVS